MTLDRPGPPILFLDVDGVISLFGGGTRADGTYQLVDGIAHCISNRAGAQLGRLEEGFELVWATGWEDKANDHLVHLLDLPGPLPWLGFDGRAVWGTAHWKLEAIEAYAGQRPLAWIDDNLTEECVGWAQRREQRAPTLLVETRSSEGMTDAHVDLLLDWAAALRS